MTRPAWTMVLSLAALLAAPAAHARFGKRDSDSSSSSKSSSSRSSSSTTTTSDDSDDTYHAAAPANSGRSSSSGPRVRPFGWGLSDRPWRYGYWSGCYVPLYGYGYGYYGTTAVDDGYAAPQPGQAGVQEEPADIRLTFGVEGMGFLNGETGGALGIGALFEGERFGFSAFAQNITVLADDGSGSYDNLPQANLHLTFALVNGRYGRLRVEGGADTIFAADVTLVGATVGASGMLWLGGQVALEGSVMATVFPYTQLDGRLGVVIGMGPVGVRVGWRSLLLNDRGVLDGVVHEDVFSGPYVGLGVVF